MKKTDFFESNTIQALIVMLELMKSNQVTICQFMKLVEAMKKQNHLDIEYNHGKNEINQLINNINKSISNEKSNTKTRSPFNE
jgi:signal transduction histidine kinase